MSEAVLDALGSVLTRWTMGGAAGAAAPKAWRAALGEEPEEAELRLLALSGQFLGALTLAEAAGAVRMRADLPRLAKPPLPETLRPRARRLLLDLRESVRRRPLLDFLDGRGWTLHPGDWLPGQTADVPDSYAPWQDWAAAENPAEGGEGALSAETWSAMLPAARRVAFAELRRRDPLQATTLLAEKIGGEPADVRVRLLEVLATGLSNADQPLLETLTGDRAPRVQALVASMLARLGHGAAENGENAAELPGFFRIETKGFLRRTRVIAMQELKTPAQQNRRAALMDALSLHVFAQSLGLSRDELAALWPWGGDIGADRSLAAMAARSAPDAMVAAMAKALTAGDAIDRYSIAPLLPRLAPEQRRAMAMQVLRAKDGTFARALDFAGGDGRIADAMRTHAGAALLSQLKAEADAKPGEAKPGDCAAELLALGLIASRDAARQAFEQVVAAGVMASDPRVDMLRLNIDLDDKGARE